MGHPTDQHLHLGRTQLGVTGFSKAGFLIDPDYVSDSLT